MAFQKNIPAATDKLKNSQGDLQGNFQALNDLIAVDHDISTFTSPASGVEGKHKAIRFVQQAGDPTVAATEKSLYTKDAGGGLGPHFFFKNSGGLVKDLSLAESGSAGNVTTFTYNLMAEFSASQNLVFKTGQTQGTKITASAATTVTYPTAFSTATAHIIVTPFINSNVDINLVIKSITSTGFVVFNPSATACDLFFFAIGR